MRKYTVKNCPAGQIVTSALNPNLAGVYCKKEHKPCEDCVDCTVKKFMNSCISPYANFDVLRNAHQYGTLTQRGKILQSFVFEFDIEEVKG